MKLRTEMLKIGGEWRLATFVGCGDDRGPATAKEHDAMASHAMDQAMDEFQINGWITRKDVQERAAEILDGWMGDRG